ncbi:SPFH domain-containing protein [Saccharopolyspora sp. WRP15-2]|uniref:SPFH domain-containing protein n=1 Tax=Saccharopolyspora oryzae TaxID=2997343 RepID=A0ABT4V386_9PSEU|nr:SPFH domain-containing protein [Saccharopolyspora oryzae]MDA3628422.1 SPFH domain-containing protein [Saccharopolyspora oryzae]
MGLFDKIRGEFIDIIDWTDDSRDTIVWRFPRHENEIKMGAKLTVRESQAAVFVNEGQVADAFPPGMYTLDTQNMPVLSTIKGWKYGFNSPFKAEVYFVNTRQFTDLKWGTQNPVIVRDPEFGMVRLRAFGGYALRVIEPVALLRELAGTDPAFRTEEVSEHLRQMIIGKLGPALAASGVPMLDLVTQQGQIGERIANALNLELRPLGIEISRFIIENVSVPPEVEAMIDKRTQMGIAGDLNQYSQFQAANAMEKAAQNDGGAGAGMGMGMGMALGQQAAAAAHQPAPQQSAPAGPPPLPQQDQWYLGANGQQLGPFDFSALGRQISSGTLTADTLVWKQGMPSWTAARQVPELNSLFGQVPPPLPPQA